MGENGNEKFWSQAVPWGRFLEKNFLLKLYQSRLQDSLTLMSGLSDLQSLLLECGLDCLMNNGGCVPKSRGNAVKKTVFF